MTDARLTIRSGIATLSIDVPEEMDVITAKGVIQQMSAFVKTLEKSMPRGTAYKHGVSGLSKPEKRKSPAAARWEPEKIEQFIKDYKKAQDPEAVAKKYGIEKRVAYDKYFYYTHTDTWRK